MCVKRKGGKGEEGEALGIWGTNCQVFYVAQKYLWELVLSGSSIRAITALTNVIQLFSELLLFVKATNSSLT